MTNIKYIVSMTTLSVILTPSMLFAQSVSSTTSASTQKAPVPIAAPVGTGATSAGNPAALATSEAQSQNEEKAKQAVEKNQETTFKKELDEEEQTDGMWVKDAPANELYQYLARKAGLQYMYNPALEKLKITGHLFAQNPLNQMEEIGFLHQLTLYKKGRTLYVMTEADMDKLPLANKTYCLKYLRPTDLEQIKSILQPALSKRGSMQLEPKTSMIVVQDSQANIQNVMNLLTSIDKPQKQIIVESKILRVSDNSSRNTGFDWAKTFGGSGLSVDATSDLVQLFNLDNSWFKPGTLQTSSGSGGSVGTGESSSSSKIGRAHV